MKKPANNSVLLIEPDTVLAQTYMAALQDAGFQVSHVESAQAAITAIDQQKPKLIILELQLRSHNGIEFLYELRSYSDLRDVPVVLLTFVPETTSGVGIKSSQLGVGQYLYKPHTSLQKLVEVVGEVVAE